MNSRFFGEIMSVARDGSLTVRRLDDRVIVIGAHEAERSGVRLQPGDKIEFGVFTQAGKMRGLTRGCDPILMAHSGLRHSAD